MSDDGKTLCDVQDITLEAYRYGGGELLSDIIGHQRSRIARAFIKKLPPNRYFVVRLDEEWIQSPRPYGYKQRVVCLTMYPTQTQRVRFAEPEYNRMSWRQLEDSAIKEIRWRVKNRWMMFWRKIKGVFQ